MISKENLYWVSWVCAEEDYRPLTYPPNDNILGWWCSGSDSSDNSILCALIKGKSEADAKKTIKKDWPEFNGKFRFFESKDNATLSDRWVLDPWMIGRISCWKKQEGK